MGGCAAVAVAQDLDCSVAEPCSHFEDVFDLQMKQPGEHTPLTREEGMQRFVQSVGHFHRQTELLITSGAHMAQRMRRAHGAANALPHTAQEDVKENVVNNAFSGIDNPGKLEEFYEVERKKLAEGSYGVVFKAKNKATQEICATKKIAKVAMRGKECRLSQEIAITKMMDHPNAIKYFESFEDLTHIHIVTELCTGGELFDRIIEVGHFTEVQAAILMQQIASVVCYMHDSHVCHRDIKPENFICASKGPIEECHLKLIDFGLSCPFKEGQVLTTKAGTPYYVAPQVLAGKYDHLVDIWSCGVLMYVLLCGYPPFFGETDREVLTKVRLGNFSFNAFDFKDVSEDAKNLIRMMLKMNPNDRPTAAQVLNNDWIKKASGSCSPSAC